MAFNQIIHNFLNETKDELKKEKNMSIIKEVIKELYPYIIKLSACVIIIVLILLLTIILNIRVILKN